MSEVAQSDPVEIIAKLNEASEVREILKPRLDLIIVIVSEIIKFMEENPDQNEDEVLYMLVREFLKRQEQTIHPLEFNNAAFAYYIEVHRALQVHRKTVEIQDQTSYNKAALSLFDLYILRPDDGNVRKLLLLSANALHEVITMIMSSVEDKPMTEVIGYLSNIALLCQTVRSYTRGAQRERNYPYIRWLKSFLESALREREFSTIVDDRTFRMAITQITNNKTVISIPH